MMKSNFRKTQSIVKGIKLTLLTIVLQSSILGLALVLKANEMLPADFVNYSGRLTSKDSPSDVMVQKAKQKKQKALVVNSTAQNEISSEELSGETSEITSAK